MAEKNKKAIIKAEAAKLFRKKGFTASSMQDIAEAVGMKAASLYNHIGSKQEILKDLLLNIAAAFTEGILDIEASSLSGMEKLEELVNLHVDLTFKYKDSISLITGEWVHLTEPELSLYRNQRIQYEEKFLAILKDCKKENLIDKNLNLDIALFSILSSLHWLYSWHIKNPKLGKTELAKQLKAVLLKGIIRT
jgi:AcrR family transcriptional regulator